MAPPPEGTTPPAPATLTHLREALARKAITSRLYGYLARQADAEGRRDLARLFRELADGETLHVYGLLEYLRPHGDPITGLEITHWDGYLTAAVTASRHESQTLFPSMAAAARAEGQSPIADWFDSLARAEANHADRLQRYRDSLTPR